MDYRNMVVILGDQLSFEMAALQNADRSQDLVVMMEVWDETQYVRHHKKKIALIFAAMRHFAEALRKAGWTVDYRGLDGLYSCSSFDETMDQLVMSYKPETILVTEASEYRIMTMIDAWEDRFGVPVQCFLDDRFLCTRDEFSQWAMGRKTLRMENFYRDMRRKTGLLMEEGRPVGGQWNFDAQNRKSLKGDLFLPDIPRFAPDMETRNVLALVAARFERHFGDLEPFFYPVTHEQAEMLLEDFITHRLPHFGDYQDAMTEGQPFLYHSLISFCINLGLLIPLDVCRRVETAYLEKNIPLNCVEGFIRQVIGWREYIRGIYWLEMPGYETSNHFGHKEALPPLYWSGQTRMNCMAQVVEQTRIHAYAHHIQRLMITGNFGLIAGIDPYELHEWYLIVYCDAFEWVEMPNVIGMSQYADGGKLASKPYASSGNYINKMSDYCQNCYYDVKKKTGERACPFNIFYWDFIAQNLEEFRKSPRMGHMVRLWQNMDEDLQHSMRQKAELYRKYMQNCQL